MFGKTNYAGKHYASWQERVEEVRALKKFIDENQSIATPLESRQMYENYKEARDAHSPAIEAGAVGEFDQAISSLRQATLKVQQERAREINRWDSNKLLSEMNLAKEMVHQVLGRDDTIPRGALVNSGKTIDQGDVSKSDAVRGILSESRASGDQHKLRATLEVLKALDQVNDNNHETKVQLGIIARESKRQLEALRQTPELATALEEREAKIDELAVKHQQLRDLNMELRGDGVMTRGLSTGNLAANYRRVSFDESGNVKIYPIDHPEVVGVFFRGEPEPPTEDL